MCANSLVIMKRIEDWVVENSMVFRRQREVWGLDCHFKYANTRTIMSLLCVRLVVDCSVHGHGRISM